MNAVRNFVKVLRSGGSKWVKSCRNIFLIGWIMFLSIPAFSHLCHDPFRPLEHLVLVPEKELIRIEEIGEFRMYIENTFRTTLRDVQLFVESPAFDIEVEPRVLRRLVPGERAFFLVKLKTRKGVPPGDYSLRISVGATSAELRPSVEKIDVVVRERIPEPKVEPIPEIKPEVKQEKIIPDEVKEEPIVREKEPKVRAEEISPPKREEILRPEERIVPVEKKPEPPVEEIELPTEAIEPREVGEVVVKVERIPFWKRPYFYIAIIVLLIGLVIWRKIKK